MIDYTCYTVQKLELNNIKIIRRCIKLMIV